MKPTLPNRSPESLVAYAQTLGRLLCLYEMFHRGSIGNYVARLDFARDLKLILDWTECPPWNEPQPPPNEWIAKQYRLPPRTDPGKFAAQVDHLRVIINTILVHDSYHMSRSDAQALGEVIADLL